MNIEVYVYIDLVCMQMQPFETLCQAFFHIRFEKGYLSHLPVEFAEKFNMYLCLQEVREGPWK